MSCCTDQLAMASLTEHNKLSSRELTPISHQNPNFNPLDPKFDPKTYTHDYKHPKTFKTTTNIRLKHQFISKSSSSHFHQKPPFFSFLIQTPRQPHQFKTHQHININKH